MSRPEWVDSLVRAHKGLTLVAVTPEKGEGVGFNFIRALEPAEVARFRQAHERVGEYSRRSELDSLLKNNFADIEQSSRAILSGAFRMSSTDGIEAARSVNRSVINYLTSVRLYLDHTATRLSRLYGPDSAPVRAFTIATKEEFDSTPVYSFVYKLRNYVQHCGMPLSRISVTSFIAQQEDGSERDVHEAFVGFSRTRLLSDYDSWGTKARSFICSGTEDIELLPTVIEFSEALARIQAVAFEAESMAVWPDVLVETRLCSEVCDARTQAALVEIDDMKSQENLSMQQILPHVNVLRGFGLLEPHPAGGWLIRPGEHLNRDVPLDIVR